MPRRILKKLGAAAEPIEVPATAAEPTEVPGNSAEASQVVTTTAEPSMVAEASEESAEDSEVGVKTVPSAVVVEVAATAAEAVGVAPDDNDGQLMSINNVVAYSKNLKAESYADPILVKLGNSVLRMSDVQLLHGPHFLNDAVLSFYMTYLDQIKYKPNLFYMFVTPELSQCLPYMDEKQKEVALIEDRLALNKSFIFFVVNDGLLDERDGNFWSILIASRPNNCFYHLASYSANNVYNGMDLFNSIKNVVGMPDATFRIRRCQKQKKDYDCGIHVMCLVDHLIEHVIRYNCVTGVSPLSQNLIRFKRKMLIELIDSMSKLGKH